MYLAVEKCNRLKVFTLQNILCLTGIFWSLKNQVYGHYVCNLFFLSVLFLLTLTKSKKRGRTIALDECYAWFYLYELRRAMKTRRKRRIHNENVRLQRESNQHPIAFQTGALDRPVTLTDDKLCSKVLHYYGIWIKSTHANKFIKCIMVLCIHTKFCKQ